jgi:flagellar basal-body rod protein FlgF
MAGGAYVALSGLRSRFEQLDRLASDLANFRTTGYKTERTTSVAAERPAFDAALQSAIDVSTSEASVDFSAGTIVPTGNDLDFLIEGSGFFTVETTAGPRYTRDGHFMRSAEGLLTTTDGFAVQGAEGSIELPPGELTVERDGTLKVNGATVDQLEVVDFDNYSVLKREGPSRFVDESGVGPRSSEGASILNGSLEQSNVSMQERLAELTHVSRSFDALQRGISVLMNDVDGRAITELGKR